MPNLKLRTIVALSLFGGIFLLSKAQSSDENPAFDSLSQGDPIFTTYQTLPEPAPGEPWVSTPLSEGRTLEPDEQAHVNDAIALLVTEEARCWLQGQGLPEIPPETPGGESQTGSEAAGNTTFGGETAPGALKEGYAGTSCPAAGPGQQTLPSGTVWTTSGGPNSANLNPDVLATNMQHGELGKWETAAALVHESYHLNGPNQVDGGTPAENEGDATVFTINWWCAVAQCTDNNALKGLAEIYIEFYRSEMQKIEVLLPPECDTGYVAPDGTDGSLPPGAPSPPLYDFSVESTLGHFVTGPSSVGTGFIEVDPGTNSINVRAMVAGHPERFAFDMNQFVPGFQVTCIDFPELHSTGTFAIGGYEIATGKGMLLRGTLDLSQSPALACTVEYIGVDFGAPYDIYVHKEKPSQVLVLDAATHSILACNIVSDSCIVLADTTQAPELSDTRRLTALRSGEPSGPPQYLTYIATSGTVSNVFKPGSENTDTQVVLIDIGGDLVIEHIRVQ